MLIMCFEPSLEEITILGKAFCREQGLLLEGILHFENFQVYF